MARCGCIYMLYEHFYHITLSRTISCWLYPPVDSHLPSPSYWLPVWLCADLVQEVKALQLARGLNLKLQWTCLHLTSPLFFSTLARCWCARARCWSAWCWCTRARFWWACCWCACALCWCARARELMCTCTWADVPREVLVWRGGTADGNFNCGGSYDV